MKIRLFKNYKAVAYLPNPYSLFQYLLLEPYGIEDTLFFIHEQFPISIAHRLPHTKLLFTDIKWNIMISVLNIYYHILRNRNIPVFLGGHLPLTDSFLRFSKNAIYMEDGVGSYEAVYNARKRTTLKRKGITGIFKRIFKGKFCPALGLAENVQKIYLTGILPVPDIIENKVELFNLEHLWNQKSKEQKETIISILLPSGFDRGIIREYNVFLLTQPFSEHSYWHFLESDKIEVYQKLVSQYDESELVIKTHPAETTDYHKYFPKAQILDLPCPMELLVLMGLRAKTFISVNSTAIFGLNDFPEKIISGYDVTPALKKEALRRGIYDGISNKSVCINSH